MAHTLIVIVCLILGWILGALTVACVSMDKQNRYERRIKELENERDYIAEITGTK